MTVRCQTRPGLPPDAVVGDGYYGPSIAATKSLVREFTATGTNPTRGNESYSEISEYTAAGLRGSVADRIDQQSQYNPCLPGGQSGKWSSRSNRGRGCDSSLQGFGRKILGLPDSDSSRSCLFRSRDPHLGPRKSPPWAKPITSDGERVMYERVEFK